MFVKLRLGSYERQLGATEGANTITAATAQRERQRNWELQTKCGERNWELQTKCGRSSTDSPARSSTGQLTAESCWIVPYLFTTMCLQFALATSCLLGSFRQRCKIVAIMQLSHQAQESHAAELAQYLEGKKSLDDFKKSVERQRCGPYSDLHGQSWSCVRKDVRESEDMESNVVVFFFKRPQLQYFAFVCARLHACISCMRACFDQCGNVMMLVVLVAGFYSTTLWWTTQSHRGLRCLQCSNSSKRKTKKLRAANEVRRMKLKASNYVQQKFNWQPSKKPNRPYTVIFDDICVYLQVHVNNPLQKVRKLIPLINFFCFEKIFWTISAKPWDIQLTVPKITLKEENWCQFYLKNARKILYEVSE